VARCRGIVHESARGRREKRIFQQVPKGRVRIGDPGDRLKVFRKAAEHLLTVCVDLFRRRAGAVLGEQSVGGFPRLARLAFVFVGEFPQPSFRA
jgi:hypothetical protein